MNLGDITKVDETKIADFNMICGGSPCQDFSVAGKQAGAEWKCKECGHKYNPLTVHWSNRKKCPECESNEIDKSRSSLLVEFLRVIRHNKPNFGIYENVKNIVGKQFKETFKMFTNELEEYGYSLHWKVLNAKDYGIPQNRERVYLIFIRKELDNGRFKFPEPFDDGIRLKDVLEDEVDEKYYISEDKVKRFLTSLNNKDSLLYDACQVKREGKSREYNDYCPTLTARDYKDPRLVNDNQVKQLGNILNGDSKIIDTQGRKKKKCIPRDVSPTLRAESHGNLPQVIQLGNIVDTGNWNNPQRGRIYSPDGCSPSLNTCGGGGLEPKIIQVGKLNSSQDGVVVDENGISPTHTAGHGNTPKVMQLGNVNPSGNGINGQVYGTDGLYPTITINKGEGSKIAIKQATKQGYIECEIGGVADLSYPNSKTRRGRVQEDGNISPTITATETGICKIESAIRIRKLIPLETFRLMGFTDEAFYKAMIGLNDLAEKFISEHPYLIGKTILDEATTIQGVSNSQLYKMSGNSIVVDVLYYIMVELYKAMSYLFDDLKLSSFFSGTGAFECSLDRLYESINTGNFTRPQVD